MAKERTVAKTAFNVASSHVAAMECVFYIVRGHLEWSPKYVRYFLDYECPDKYDSETFRDYLERKNGNEFTNDEWSNLAKECGWIFDKMNDSSTLDISALVRLFECLFSMKESKDHWSMMSQLKKLRNLRNKVMHSLADIMDPSHLEVLGRELHAFIREAGNFYELNIDEIDGKLRELKIDFEKQFAQGKMQLYQVLVSVVNEGRSVVTKFLQYTCTTENLLFGMGRVNKLDVFHELSVMLRDGSRTVHNYKKIFENPHPFIIVSGVAGSGKSTLLENIAVEQVQALNDASTGVTNYELLLYIQCRDRYSNTLNEVLTQFFPDMCALHGLDVVREALRRVRVVYLIDGFDEYSSEKTVLQDVVNMSWKSNCRVIITTRPHAASKLHTLLSRIKYAEFEIAPLTRLKEQLNFLSKYEPYLSVSQKKGFLQTGFKKMKPALRNLFTEPLKLIQFSNVFVSFPEKISKWETPYDAAEDFFLVYRSLIETQLVPALYKNMSAVIDDIFLIIGQAALVYLNSNTLTFKEDDIEQIQRQCLSLLRENHNIKDLDMENVLSSILKMKRPISRQKVVTYAFNHKTDQEYFASRYVIRQIQTDYDINQVLLGRKLVPTSESEIGDTMEVTDSLPPMAKKPRLQLQRLREVLQFVVQDLNSKDGELLESRWPQLSVALKEAGLDSHKDWQDYMLSCPHIPRVAKEAASLTLSHRRDWMILDRRDVVVVAAMLPYAQPRSLGVRAKLADLRGKHWTRVVQLREGALSLHMSDAMGRSLTPCDEILAPMRNCSASLGSFHGCISSDVGVAALGSAATRDTELDITIEKPLDLSTLNGKCKNISVKTRVFAPVAGASTPLPAVPRPELTVVEASAGSWRAVACMIQALAPSGNRYGRVVLTDCELRPDELTQLVRYLQQQGIRTDGQGTTRWKDKWANEYRLFLCDQPSC